MTYVENAVSAWHTLTMSDTGSLSSNAAGLTVVPSNSIVSAATASLIDLTAIFKPTRRMANQRATLAPVDLFKSQLARGAPIEAARHEVLRCLVAPRHFRQDGIP